MNNFDEKKVYIDDDIVDEVNEIDESTELKEDASEKAITINEFIERYNSYLSNRAKYTFLDSIIKKDIHTPYALKIVTADNILKNSHFNNQGQLLYNTPKENIMYIFGVLMLYTKLDINDDVSSFYDYLDEKEIINYLLVKIDYYNSTDFKNFKKVFESRKNDFMLNYRVTKINTDDIAAAVQLGMAKGMDFLLGKFLEVIQNEQIFDKLQQIDLSNITL